MNEHRANLKLRCYYCVLIFFFNWTPSNLYRKINNGIYFIFLRQQTMKFVRIM